jgi:hypothetical protein
VPAKKVVAPSHLVQELLTEKAILEKEIYSGKKRLVTINARLRLLGHLVAEDLIPADEQPLAPSKKLNLIDAIEKISNESPSPLSKAEIRQRLVAMGLPRESFNNYFYQAIRKLRSRGRIGVLEDGRIWRPTR